MKVMLLDEIRKNRVYVAKQVNNLWLAKCFTLFLGSIAAYQYYQGDFNLLLACVLPVPLVQMAVIKTCIAIYTPDEIEKALEKLKKRNVDLSVNNKSVNDKTAEKLARDIIDLCQADNKKIENIKWLFSAVDPHATKLTIKIGNEVRFDQLTQ